MRWRDDVLNCILILFVTLFAGTSTAENFAVIDPLTFQEALNRAQSNDDDDTIYLTPTTYHLFEPLAYWAKQDVIGQPPHVENHSLTIDGIDSSQTILDGNGKNILLIDTLAVPEALPITVTIKNVTFKNAGTGPSLSIVGTASSIRVDNCVFINNRRGGAELLTTTGGITVAYSAFQGNSAYQGCGVFVSSSRGILSLKNNTFTGNASAVEGGGAYCIIDKEGMITISNNVFKDNHATSIGGGLAAIAMDGGQINLAKNIFENNRVGDQGGGAYLCAYDMDKIALLILTENTFTANSAVNNGGGAYVYANRAQLGVSHSTCKQNRAGFKGGAVYSETTNSGASFINSVIAENIADDGGGIYAHTDFGEIVLTNTTCVNNTGETHGGGVYVHLGSNTARAGIYNTILWDNTVGARGEDVYIHDDGDGDGTGAAVQFYHNAYARLAVKDGDRVSSGHTITANPDVTSDYHLQSGSPCIDAGSNTAPQIPDKDMDSRDRIIDGDDDDESIIDIGADEYDPSTPPATTTTTTSTAPPPACMIRNMYGEESYEVAVLRRFRDEIMAHIPTGNTMIALYYRLSSFITESMKERSALRHEVTWMVDTIVRLVQKHFAPAEMCGTPALEQRRNRPRCVAQVRPMR